MGTLSTTLLTAPMPGLNAGLGYWNPDSDLFPLDSGTAFLSLVASRLWISSIPTA